MISVVLLTAVFMLTPAAFATPKTWNYMPSSETGTQSFIAANPTYDGRGVAVAILSSVEAADVWIYGPAQGTWTRLTFEGGYTTFGGLRVPLRDPLPGGTNGRRYDTSLWGPQDPTLPRTKSGGRDRARVRLRFEVAEEDGVAGVRIHLVNGQTSIPPYAAPPPRHRNAATKECV